MRQTMLDRRTNSEADQWIQRSASPQFIFFNDNQLVPCRGINRAFLCGENYEF